jgi:predicted acylesterase/phospholipase RssA|tara:strand:- start:1104 stop:1979 length:876 start_codon:yes stop_codon:yes gene_type:complete
MYSNLVLSGGAFRGLGILGAIKYLEETDLIKNFKQYIGTSAGAIICFFLIIGYKSYEIKEIILNEINNIVNIDIENIAFILDDYGLNDTSQNKEILEKYLDKKINQKSITFIEFSKKFGVNLIITGSNLTKRRLEYFNINEYPNMNIIDALLITSCIPIIYKPITFNEDLYVDGGIYNNFPYKYFDKNSNDTLGIYVKSTYSNNNENFMNYINNIIYSVFDNITDFSIKDDTYNICYIKFNDSSDSDMDFGTDLKIEIKSDKIEENFNYGYNIFKNYLNNILKKQKKILEL